MRLLSVLLVFALCNGLLTMPREGPMIPSQLLAIEGPLYVDSASLMPATLTTLKGVKRNNFNLPNSFSRSNLQNDFNPNKRLFSSLQAQTMMNRLLRIQNDPQLNFEFDRSAFAQNTPLQLNQNTLNDQLKRLILVNQLQNPYTQNDMLQNSQFDHMNAQNDRNLLQNLQFDSFGPQEKILRVFAIPVSVTVPVQNPYTFNDAQRNDFLHQQRLNQLNARQQNDPMLQNQQFQQHSPYTQNSPFSQLDQLNAQMDFLHQQRLNQLNARQQNDPMLQNQQFQQHSPYTQNSPFSQLDQLNAQIDFLHQQRLNQLNARQQNDPMQWLQNQQMQQQNPYTQNVPFQTNQFNPQNDQFQNLLQNLQFDQFRVQNIPLNQHLQHHQFQQKNLNDFVTAQNAQNFQNNPVWLMPDEDHDEQQLQSFGTNFQGDQLQNFLQNSQQQNSQQQNFGKFPLSDESSNDFASEHHNDDDY